MYGLNQLGFDKDMMALAFPQLAAQLDPPSYTEGDYQRIDGVWNLVQQASDGSVKYTPMDEDFVPESRMLGADELQKGILEFNTELQKSDARLTDIDYVLEGMDAIPEEEWRRVQPARPQRCGRADWPRGPSGRSRSATARSRCPRRYRTCPRALRRTRTSSWC